MGETRMRSKWCVLAVWVVAACGGDDSNDGVVTGFPAEQKLSTLSDDDVKKACRSISQGALAVVTPTALVRATCLTVAIPGAVTYTNNQASVDVDKCQQAVDACVSSSSETEVDEEDDCDEATANDVKDCEVTVGEYETCINLVLSALQRRLSEMTCQNAEKLSSEEEYNNEDFDPANIPQCQSLMSKCPEAQLGIPYAD